MRCRRKYLIVLILTGIVYAGLQASSSFTAKEGAQPHKSVIIDDFENRKTIRPWQFVADRVMGGVSTGNISIAETDRYGTLKLTGSISLENNGGFIQARKSLRVKGKHFDASGFDGIYLRVKGNDKPYAIHLRSRDTIIPWHYYTAPFESSEKWNTVLLPFSNFKPEGLKKPLDMNRLHSIGIVAIGQEMDAELYIDEIGLYQGATMYRKLTPEEAAVILNKGTERPFTGEYYNHFEPGVYTCRQCDAPLYYSFDKFRSDCGWPSFDDAIDGQVQETPDADGRRTEIVCSTCKGHLGHVFRGEQMTPKNTRHCVNSVSMSFTPQKELGRAIFASGCFWGTEYFLQRAEGVLATRAGYIGGKIENPTYKQVCSGASGHAEAVEVIYDPEKTTYETLAKVFFETHDPTQLNRQGPDIGHQYRSGIFYTSEEQKATAEKLVKILEDKKLKVKTEITPADRFWPAELYHQDYYNNTGKMPYCHGYTKRF